MSYINAIKKNNDVLVWERVDGKREIVTYRAPYYFYTKSPNGVFTSIYGDKLERHDFATGKEFMAGKSSMANAGHELFESDIAPELKILSEKYYEVPAPKLHITFYDIEYDYDIDRGYATMDDPYAPINSVALYNQWENRMVLYSVPPPNYDGPTDSEELLKELSKKAPLPTDCTVEVNICLDEEELLLHFLNEIEDSDVISGWNSSGFDDPYTAKRLERMGKRFLNRLSFAEARPPRFKLEMNSYGSEQTVVEIHGRIAADYLLIFKKYEVVERPTFKLEAIADEILVDKETGESILPKLEYEGTLSSLYHTDFIMFIRYNLRDTEILKGFEDRLGYIELANQMAHMSTGLFKYVTGTIKLSDLATVNYCHHEMDGLIVNDVNTPEDTIKAKGAFVLLPQVGEHDWIGSIDINSLYPSVIRSLNISPETIVGQFLEEEDAFEAIKHNSSKVLSLVLECGETLNVEASEWKGILKTKGWAISGFGTVFSQKKKGIMPAILEDWYLKRQHFQKLLHQCKERGEHEQAVYYDKIQYIYKIKLNSYYGSLLNAYFRFYDKRLGESTTAASRAILLHQCAKVTELLDGEYMLPDRTEVDKNDKEHIGYSKKWSMLYGDSVAADTTLILENGGDCHIEDMFKTVDEAHDNGKEYYFPNNMKTLTYDEAKNKTVFEDVLYVMRHKTTKKMFRVWFTNSTYIDVTEDHSLIGYNKNSEEDASCLIEVKPTELNNNLIFLKNIPRNNIKNYGHSRELYRLLGLIIGDGSVGSCDIVLNNIAKHIDDIENDVLNPLIEQGIISTYYVTANNIRISGNYVLHTVNTLLSSLSPSMFPTWLFDETIENLQHFLRGYFSAVGAVYNNVVVLNSTQLHIITAIQQLLFYCGIASNHHTEYNGNLQHMQLSMLESDVFIRRIGFIQTKENEKRMEDWHDPVQYDFSIIRGVHKVEEITYDDYVYDIEVGNTHMFFANKLLVHNTDSSYFATHGKTQEEATLIADTVATEVDKSFPPFMRDVFLCTPGFDTIIATARENITSKGIFIDKKRYILRVVDNEGFMCDKLKIMGVELKKTTLPKPISQKLTTFIERYLKGLAWEELSTDIVEYKTLLYDTDDVLLIGLPKGIKQLEHYTRIFNKPDSTVKVTIPGHVSASIHYNQCLDLYNDNESMRITSGMKIKVFYLQQKIGRFKSIALPTDIKCVPEWFFNNFNINRAMHIERLVDKPLSNIIKAIDKTVPSKQSLSNDSLIGF